MNISDVLKMRINDIEDVPMLPEGTYAAVITGMPKLDNFGQDQKPGAEVSFKLTAPQQDVDPDTLQKAGGIPAEPLRYTFWFTPKALPIFRNFVKDVLGVDGDGGIADTCAQMAGLECLVVIKHKQNFKTKRSFANIDGFAPV